jgi:hypothetical protein
VCPDDETWQWTDEALDDVGPITRPVSNRKGDVLDDEALQPSDLYEQVWSQRVQDVAKS